MTFVKFRIDFIPFNRLQQGYKSPQVLTDETSP